MAELQKMISEQSFNGSANSDLMKAFVAKNRSSSSDNKPEMPKTSPGVKGGASIFATNTTTTNTTTTGSTDTTDNANIMQQKNDNHHINTTTTTTTTKDTTTTTTNQMDNRNTTPTNTTTNTTTTNANLNRNANNANKANAKANPKQVACPDRPDPNANVSEIDAILKEVRGAMSEQRQQLVSQVTESAVDAHLSTCINTHKAVREGRERFAQMKASGMLPDMSKLSLSAGSMWEKMMDQMMPEMNKTMTFFKMLPGFSDLGQGDQMKLIKAGMFEVMMTRFAMLIDNEDDTMLDPSHKMVCPRHVVKAMPMGDFLDGFFHVGQQFNPLGLSDRQVSLFTAVLAFSPSRPGLSDAQLVSRLQALYQQALYCSLKDNHSDPDSKLRQTLALVPMFRRMSEEHAKALGHMKSQSPDAFTKQFPPIHREVYAQAQ